MGRTSRSAADLRVGPADKRTAWSNRHFLVVSFYRRRLPHWHEADHPVFVTWRLHGSLPRSRVFPASAITSGEAFAVMDRLLDEARSGPLYLRQSRIAEMILENLLHNATVLGRYDLHGFVIMPNHVHMLVPPHIPLWQVTKALKSFTGTQPNRILHLTGNSFWQDESLRSSGAERR